MIFLHVLENHNLSYANHKSTKTTYPYSFLCRTGSDTSAKHGYLYLCIPNLEFISWSHTISIIKASSCDVSKGKETGHNDACTDMHIVFAKRTIYNHRPISFALE